MHKRLIELKVKVNKNCQQTSSLEIHSQLVWNIEAVGTKSLPINSWQHVLTVAHGSCRYSFSPLPLKTFEYRKESNSQYISCDSRQIAETLLYLGQEQFLECCCSLLRDTAVLYYMVSRSRYLAFSLQIVSVWEDLVQSYKKEIPLSIQNSLLNSVSCHS